VRWNLETGTSQEVNIPNISYSTYPSDGCGNHSIAINPSESVIATGK
jgi:hypothetical protein